MLEDAERAILNALKLNTDGKVAQELTVARFALQSYMALAASSVEQPAAAPTDWPLLTEAQIDHLAEPFFGTFARKHYREFAHAVADHLSARAASVSETGATDGAKS